MMSLIYFNSKICGHKKIKQLIFKQLISILQANKMNNKYNFNVILKHSKMQYKKGPHTYALMLVNGEWITSTKSNDEAHRLLIAQIKHKEYQADKRLGIHIPKRLPNKTKAMTYLQTVDAQKLLDSGACSMYRLSKTISVDPRAIKRCIKFLINFGEKGFYEHG